MSIEGISGNNIGKIQGFNFVEQSLTGKAKEVSTGDSFGSFFQAAIDTLNETSRLEQEAQSLQLDYITGKTDDMLSVSLAEQKAYTAINFTVQVTNKIIDSYKQIISIQL